METSVLRRLSRDPVAQFLFLGTLVFALDAALGGRAEDAPIVVSTGFVDGLVAQHRERFGRAPSPSETEQLVARHVREEVLVALARDAGLDRGDPIVRRRLAQKMELLLRGNLQVPRPTEAELRRYVAEHPDDYTAAPRVGLRHAFFSRDRRADARADAAAWRASAESTANAAGTPVGEAALAGVGDAFPFGQEVASASRDELTGKFGAAFATAVEGCPLRELCGPVESTYGFHVVLVRERLAAAPMPFEAARASAESRLLEQRETAALEREIAREVRERGVVRVTDRSAR